MSVPPVHDAPRPLAELLDDVAGFLSRYMYFESRAQLDAVTLWAVSTHVFDAFDVVPYLNVRSPEKRSGKSLLFDLLYLLVRNPLLTGNISPAALYRIVDEQQSTVLIDEADAIFTTGRKADPQKQELRGLLNAGYRKGLLTYRMSGTKMTEAKAFDAFGPKAIAGIGALPDTIADRSIPIAMQRKPRNVSLERCRLRKVKPVGEAIRDELAVATDGLAELLSHTDPFLPEELNDRQQDTWELLLAVADEASDEWGARTRSAAITISKDTEDDTETQGQELLADVLAVWGEGEAAIHSQDLVDRLNGLEERSYSGWNAGAGIKSHELARKLAPYGPRSKDIKLEGITKRGYRRDDFEVPWQRYVNRTLSATSATSATSHAPIDKSGATPSATGVLPDTEGSTEVAPEVAPSNPVVPREVAGVAEVAHREGSVAADSEGHWRGLAEDVSPNGSFTEIKIRGRAPMKVLKDKLIGDAFAAGDSVTIELAGDLYVVTNTTRGREA